jgi:hypothetical protein
MVNKELAKETEILRVQLRLSAINLPDTVASALIHLPSWWLELLAARLSSQQ